MKVLVVDDDGYIRQLISALLAQTGHEVCCARNGQEAVSLWQQESPDLILMDLMMPVMDGYEAAIAIKHEAGDEFTPIVFMTGASDDKSMIRCLNAGDDFLMKPINPAMLEAKIRAHSRHIELNRKVLKQNEELAYFRAKVSAEFDMTEQIMKVALANSQEHIRGVDVHCSAYSRFNGDLVLQHEKRDGGLYLLIGDFTGHGLAASMGSVPVAQAFATLTERNTPVGVMARELNRILHRFLPRSMFFAMTLIELNAPRTLAEVWAGGLPDALVIAQDGALKRRLGSTHMPVGILEHHEFESFCETVELAEGDRILLYTDGVTEATEPSGELFGEERLLDVVRLPCGENLIERTLDAIRAFMQADTFQDDLSLVLLECSSAHCKGEALVGSEDEAGSDRVSPEEGESDLFGQPAFQADFNWQPRQLKEPDPLLLVRQWLGHHEVVRREKELVLSVLSEIFNNALEHGLLELDSSDKDNPENFSCYYQNRSERLQELEAGFISLSLGFENKLPLELKIVIRDSGRGFDFRKIDWSDSEATFGRGLPLIRELSREMEYEDEGATLRLMLPLS